MKNKIPLHFLAYFVFIAFLSSCANKKQIAYFQKGLGGHDTVSVAQAYVPTIQPGDILGIYVSSLNSAASSFFNPFSTESGAASGDVANTGGASQAASQSYLVDDKGSVELPLIRTVKVAGLTTLQARELVKQKLAFYLKEPTVNLRLLNYRISVTGEVAKPSVYVIQNEKITLPEALTLAGDLTVFGKRENVMIVRDVDGKKEFGYVDLTRRDVFSSPYFYLRPGDMVYVEPTKAKTAQNDILLRVLPIAIAAVTALTLLLRVK